MNKTLILRIFNWISSKVSYGFALVFFTLMTAWIAAFYGFSFVHASIVTLHPVDAELLIKFFITGLIIATILHLLHFGAMHRLKLHGFSKKISLVNREMDNLTELFLNGSEKRINEFHKALVSLPFANMFVSTFYSFTFVIVGAAFLYYFTNQRQLPAMILIGGTPACFIYGYLALQLTEYLTGLEKIKTELKLYRDYSGFTPKKNISNRLKGIIVIILVLFNMILLSYIIRINSDQYIVNIFIAESIFTVGLVIYIQIFTVGFTITSLNISTERLASGKSGLFFPATSDREFVDFSINYNKAAQEIISFRQNLEKTVRERTSELEIESNKLKIRNEIMEFDIELAKKIQDQLIPKKNPTDYIYSLYKPMEEVGGDLFDFINFRGSNKIGIFISDVSGHGVPAAFITSMLKTTILQAGNRRENPADLMHYINDVLQDQTGGNFITAFYCIYNPGDRSILYSNAGHPQPYIITNNGVTLLQKGNNTALAMFPNILLEQRNKSFVNFKETLPVNSKILLYTDGLTEAAPIGSDLFFENSYMTEIFMEYQNLSCNFFIGNLYKRLVEFRGNDSFEDDVCLVCVDVI